MKKWHNFISEVKNKRKTIAFIICVNSHSKILVIKRSPTDEAHPKAWDLPGGHIDDEDKSIEDGVLRELEEETGLKSSAKDLIYVEKKESADADKYYYTTTQWINIYLIILFDYHIGD